MDCLSAYEKHMRFMQNVYCVEDVAEKELVYQFELLLSGLPNGGKLYKYRSLCGKSFEHIYDSLSNGYLWMANATTLNDDYDSTLITNAAEANKCLVDYVMQDHDKTLYALMKQFGEAYWNEDALLKSIPFDELMNVFDSGTGKMDDDKIISLFNRYDNGIELFKRFKGLVYCLIEQLQIMLKRNNEDMFLVNDTLRSRLNVYSMSESYDLGNMWGYYADAGHGFCIEYDYTLAKRLGVTAMRYLINTYKVIYSDVPRRIPIELMVKASFFNDSDEDVLENIRRSVLKRVISKDKCWEHEREWRIVLEAKDCKAPIDIVSAIIIDERSLEKTNTKKLIRLCRKRGWPVKIRRNCIYETSHRYENFT